MRDPIKIQERRDARRALESALLRLSESQGLVGFNAVGYRDEAVCVIEGIAHELAHVLDLGPDFEVAIGVMEDAEANDHEAAVLRVEVAALAELGVNLSVRRLWATANWRERGRVPLARMTRPLDRHERACVGYFVTMVRREMEIEETMP